MARAPGVSVRLKLTLSYTGFLLLAGTSLLALWAVLLAFFPQAGLISDTRAGIGGAFEPGRSPTQRAFGELAAAVLIFLLLFGLIGGWILAGRMLAPLTRITEATRWAAAGSLTHRIHMRGRSDEFRELADTFDAMLARLEAQITEQQRFAANASHELRTPLTITRTLLEVAGNDPDRDNDQLVHRLEAINTRAIDLTEALLLLSRADQRSFAPELVDLSLLAEEAAETLLPLADKRGVTIETSADVSLTVGSPALLLQLTTNLIHNAIIHNMPDRGIATRARPTTVLLTVENTGETLSPELIATLTEPFQRGSGRTRSDHSGVGLGLAIANSIASAHRGTLTLTPRGGGGLSVVVELPATPGRPALLRPQQPATPELNQRRST